MRQGVFLKSSTKVLREGTAEPFHLWNSEGNEITLICGPRLVLSMQLLAGWGQEGGLRAPPATTLWEGRRPRQRRGPRGESAKHERESAGSQTHEPLFSCLECGQREAGSDGRSLVELIQFAETLKQRLPLL